ncbi:MAG: hypothetical protein GX868_02225 [Actinobacteria bacterium]|nr:hypothetical protein [Actinomycetota bacterium]
MTVQLALLNTAEPAWKISEETREVGRRGLVAARAALHNTPRTRNLHDEALQSPADAPDSHIAAA